MTTTAKRARLRWLVVAAGTLALEAVMIALAFLWVWIYATFINSSGDEAFYEAYARLASPIVALVGGIPVFFAGCYLAGKLVPD